MHPKFVNADRISGEVIGAAIETHRIMGPGLLEVSTNDATARVRVKGRFRTQTGTSRHRLRAAGGCCSTFMKSSL